MFAELTQKCVCVGFFLSTRSHYKFYALPFTLTYMIFYFILFLFSPAWVNECLVFFLLTNDLFCSSSVWKYLWLRSTTFELIICLLALKTFFDNDPLAMANKSRQQNLWLNHKLSTSISIWTRIPYFGSDHFTSIVFHTDALICYFFCSQQELHTAVFDFCFSQNNHTNVLFIRWFSSDEH